MKFEIKHRWDGMVLFSIETDSFKLAVEAAIKAKADLSWANLSKADLSKADLSWADLSWADLSEANLSKANLSKADLSEANLSWANLSSIKNDFWDVLLRSIKEVSFLRQALIEGKVDGSHYEGECACLVGTIAHAKKCKYDSIPNLNPDQTRPSERFFLSIKKGDTPETNQCSKLAVQWIDEWMGFLPEIYHTEVKA